MVFFRHTSPAGRQAAIDRELTVQKEAANQRLAALSASARKPAKKAKDAVIELDLEDDEEDDPTYVEQESSTSSDTEPNASP